MANLINDKYFKSKDIKVFPSSFRGNYKSGAGSASPEITFDPEARLNTESNFILPTTTMGKKTSYIVKYDEDNNKIAFVLGGYYFEIMNTTDYIDEIAGKELGIKLRAITLQDPTKLGSQYAFDSKRQTTLLDSWEDESENVLDILYEYQQDKYYYFAGLKVLTGSEPSAARLKLFNADKTVNQAAFLPDLSQGTGENTLLHGEGLLAGGKNQTVVGKYNKNNINNLFEIGSGTSDSTRKNALEVNADKTTVNTSVGVTGSASITGSLTVSGKVKSSRTTDTDSPDTLITKSYVDNMVGGIGSGSTGGGAGQYVKSVSQQSGAVTTEFESFESTISDNGSNAPTSKAVNDFVVSKINELEVEEIGGTNTYIQRISETDGKISATSRPFSTVINASSNDSTAPTAKAVYNYINKKVLELTKKMSNDIDSAVGGLGVTSSGKAGSYIKEIKQDNGKIEPKLQAFDNSISSESTTDNAPTSKVVYDFVNTAIANIWTTTLADGNKLKNIILEATYPVGSIYMQYISPRGVAPEQCPIAVTLGGTWEQITAGQFLRAADENTKGDIGGSKDAVIINHTHDIELEPEQPTVTLNSFTGSGWFEIRNMNHDGVKPILGVDKTRVTLESKSYNDSKETIDGTGTNHDGHQKVSIRLDHTHTVSQAEHTHTGTAKSPDNSGNGIDKNLPPYLTVYMWKRTK